MLVLLHHPPFTNSRVTSDALHVQRDFVPPFSRSAKTLAMISGHVHNYERFLRDGKTFLVAGGGGGPRAPLIEGARRRHADDLFPGGRIRAFHYLRFRPAGPALEVEVRGLEKDGSGFDTMERFELAGPRRVAAMSRLGHGDLFHRAAAILRGLLRPGLPAAAAAAPCLVIGHRGAARFEAENTIPAFRRALELGADTVEADVSVTADGRFALWHDADPDDICPRAPARRGEARVPAEVPRGGLALAPPGSRAAGEELDRHYGYEPNEPRRAG